MTIFKEDDCYTLIANEGMYITRKSNPDIFAKEINTPLTVDISIYRDATLEEKEIFDKQIKAELELQAAFLIE